MSAHAFLDAASASSARRSVTDEDRATANSYVQTARTLADMPVLSVDQRQGILHRIQTSSVAISAR